jgi:nitroreductase
MVSITNENLEQGRAGAGLVTRLKTIARGLRDRAKRQGVVWAATGRSQANLYFAITRGLSREAYGVAAGQQRYRLDHSAERRSYFLLRRNIHRLEKGLIMRPRRSVFAKDYLPETLRVYARAVAASVGHEPHDELLWAQSVLTEYFAVVDRTDPVIARAWTTFSGISLPSPSTLRMFPYARGSEPPPVDFERFMALCRRRRSIRWFLDRPVPRELVDQAFLAAGQAPSACNRQPFVFRVFDDKDRARQIAAIPLGTKGFSHEVPAIVAVVGRLRAYPLERDRHAIYVDGSLAAMSFMFALETLGLASCPINWPDTEPQESIIARELNLDPDERVVMLIAFGYPDPEGLIPYSAKRELQELRVYG